MLKQLFDRTNNTFAIFLVFFVLLLVIGSSTAVAYTGFSEGNKSFDIHKNIITKDAESSKYQSLPLNPEFIKHHNHSNIRNIVSASPSYRSLGPGTGPTPMDFSYLNNFFNPSLAGSLPSSYDLRTLGRVTSVKDQDPTGTCYIFATLGSLESVLMPGENDYFSEQNMRNRLSWNYTGGFDTDSWGHPDIGNSLMTTAFLARWDGPVNNSDDPWDPNVFTSPTTLPIQKHVQDVIFLLPRSGPTDNDAIKQAIMNYGGVDCGIDDENAALNPTTSGYYVSSSSQTEPSHYITLVGWDDAYSRNNFLTTPPGDGCFIAKNSWGTGFGDNGYFYISYYDVALAKFFPQAVFTGESPGDYQNIYQHDPFGWISAIYNPSGGLVYGASVFTANSDEIFKAVSFYVPVPNSEYTISIYKDTGSQPINNLGPVLTQSVTLPLGYHTVPLSSDVNLQAGKTFSIVIVPKVSPSYQPYSFPVSGYNSNATAIAGESFISNDGISWDDVTSYFDNGTLCIKAFTIEAPITKLTPVLAWTPNPLASIVSGTTLDGDLDATATYNGQTVLGTFAYTDENGNVVTATSVLSVGTHKLTATFTPTDTATYTSGGMVQNTIVVYEQPTQKEEHNEEEHNGDKDNYGGPSYGGYGGAIVPMIPGPRCMAALCMAMNLMGMAVNLMDLQEHQIQTLMTTKLKLT